MASNKLRFVVYKQHILLALQVFVDTVIDIFAVKVAVTDKHFHMLELTANQKVYSESFFEEDIAHKMKEFADDFEQVFDIEGITR